MNTIADSADIHNIKVLGCIDRKFRLIVDFLILKPKYFAEVDIVMNIS